MLSDGESNSGAEPDLGAATVSSGSRFYRFLRYSHILSYSLREILEEGFLRRNGPPYLTRVQFCFLKLIALNADLQVGEIARCLGASSAATSKTIDKLERLGLVVRTGSRGDRRATLVATSEKGRDLVRAYEGLKSSRIAPVVEALGEQADHLCDLLEDVCVGLVEGEQTVTEHCLRCSGYYEEHCSIGLIHGGCALERCSARASERQSKEAL